MADDADRPRLPSEVPSPAERLWHFVTLLSLGSLFAVYGLGWLLAPEGDVTALSALLLLVQTSPLLLCLPTLLRGSARTAALLGFLAIGYFGVGVLTATDPATRVLGSFEVLFSITLFVASSYFARQRGVRDAARAGTGTGTTS